MVKISQRVGSLAEEESFLQNIIRKYIFGLNRPVPSSIDKEPEPKESAPPVLPEKEYDPLDKSFSGDRFVPPRRKPSVEGFVPPNELEQFPPASETGVAIEGFVPPNELKQFPPASETGVAIEAFPDYMAEQYLKYHNPSNKGQNKRYTELFKDKEFSPPEGSNLRDIIKFATQAFKQAFEERELTIEQFPQYWEKVAAIESTSGKNKEGKKAKGLLQNNLDTIDAIAKQKADSAEFAELYDKHGARDFGYTGKQLLEMHRKEPERFSRLMVDNDEVSVAVSMVIYIMKVNPKE